MQQEEIIIAAEEGGSTRSTTRSFRFWRRKNTNNKRKKTKVNDKMLKQKIKDLEYPPLDSKRIEPSHPSPPPRIQRVIAKEGIYGDTHRPLKTFFPLKYQHQFPSPRSSTGNHQCEAPMTCSAKLGEKRYKKTSKGFAADDLCSTNSGSIPRGRRGADTGENANEVKVGKLESRIGLSEIFSTPHGHDQKFPTVVQNNSQQERQLVQQQQHQHQQQNPQQQQQPDEIEGIEHDHADGGRNKGFLQIAKESLSIFFAEEIEDLEKEGFFFCVGGGCGDDLYDDDDDDMADDDMTYDADDMRMLNETFLTVLTCAMDDVSDFSEDSYAPRNHNVSVCGLNPAFSTFNFG